MPSGGWQHVAVVRIGSTVAWFLNGEPNGEAKARREVAYGGGDLCVGADLHFVSADDLDGNAEYLDGFIGQLALLNVALAPDEISGLFLAQRRRFQPPPPKAAAAAAGQPQPRSVAEEWAREAREAPASPAAEGGGAAGEGAEGAAQPARKELTKREQREKRIRWKERHLDEGERAAQAAARHREERRHARAAAALGGGGGGGHGSRQHDHVVIA